MKAKTFLNLFFYELNDKNIRYTVLRNFTLLPNSLNGSDLDILIDEKDVKKFYILLDDILLNTNGKIITKYGKLTPRICIAGYIENEYYGLQLDVHEGILPFKGYNTFPLKRVFEHSILHNNIYVTNNDDANLIAFLKEVLHNKTCKKSYFDLAVESWKKNAEYEVELSGIYSQNFLKHLNEIFKSKYNEEKLKDLSKIGRKDIINTFSKKLNMIKESLLRLKRLYKTPGYTVAFLGTDGSGKSTIIDKITPSLNEAVHNSLYYEHMRPNFIPNIAQLFGKKKETINVTNPHSSKPSGTVGSILRLLYYTFDYTIGYFLKIYKMNVKKSSLWIFDRYFYDYLIDQKRARLNLPKWFIRMILFFIPKPDLIICLGADAKKIFERKNELTLEEIERQVKELNELSKYEKNAYWIDTGYSIEESSRSVYQLIINEMAKRYKC